MKVDQINYKQLVTDLDAGKPQVINGDQLTDITTKNTLSRDRMANSHDLVTDRSDQTMLDLVWQTATAY